MLPSKTLFAAAIVVVSCALLGCQQADAPKQGTYTAARHRAIGSNIPQPDSAESSGNTYAGPGETGSLNVLTPSRSSGGSR